MITNHLVKMKWQSINSKMMTFYSRTLNLSLKNKKRRLKKNTMMIVRRNLKMMGSMILMRHKDGGS